MSTTQPALDDSTSEPPRPNSRFDQERRALVARADNLLRCALGEHGTSEEERERLISELDELFDLAKALKNRDAISHARRLLARLDEQAPADWGRRDQARTEYALCTYKDPDLNVERKLRQALEILRSGWDLSGAAVENDAVAPPSEVLSLAGAIHKRMWQRDGRKEDLERCAAYYRRGNADGPAADEGYAAICTAFALDQLAWIESREARAVGGDAAISDARRLEAMDLRRSIIQALDKEPTNVDQYWVAATVAEAHFGLNAIEEARAWLARSRELAPDPWQLESTAQQLIALSRIQVDVDSPDDLERSPQWKLIGALLGEATPAADSSFRGKVGLALSGGGFRASFFHIGILARLAELDLLRHVEAISCVSGGSILGAHYYLELKRLLESKADDEITRDDYVELVKRLERDFFVGVRKNIRMRVATNLLANLKMMFTSTYTRTHRLGELYEKHLYSRVDDGNGRAPRRMRDLFIRPKAHAGRFDPRSHNWQRRNKVPTLLLNATALNTGHNWQFSASWMGESPSSTRSTVDANERLRRLYYDQAPSPHADLRLGHAVAASSCVPGLFEPLVFENLYPDRTIRLVDGGLYDNQGTVGLIEQDCETLIVSDACGQLESLENPSDSALGVLGRSNGVMMERIRGSEYSELESMRKSNRLRGLVFVHLKKGLVAEPVDWVDCDDPHEASEFARARSDRGTRTSYNVPKSHQRRLASIRTDLDAFNEAEAFALMESGYRMVAAQLPRSLRGLPKRDVADEVPWRFRDVAAQLDDARDSTHLARALDVGGQLLLKAWQVSPGLRWLGRFLLAGAAALVVWGLAQWNEPFEVAISREDVLLMAGTVVLGLVAGKRIAKLVTFRSTVESAFNRLWIAIGGFTIGWVQVALLDPFYLRFGRVARRERPPAALEVDERSAPAAAG